MSQARTGPIGQMLDELLLAWAAIRTGFTMGNFKKFPKDLNGCIVDMNFPLLKYIF